MGRSFICFVLCIPVGYFSFSAWLFGFLRYSWLYVGLRFSARQHIAYEGRSKSSRPDQVLSRIKLK